MSDAHEDFLNGLHVVECELERVIGELDEMQDRNGIPTLDRVSLDPLQWALKKLADDLHDASAEIRKARLEVVSARRGEEDAWELRDAARQLHLVECRKYNAEVERRLELEKQLAEMKGREELQNVYGAGQAGRIVGLEGVVESLTAERDRLQQQVAELTKKLGELPTEPAPEPYQWQIGDEIECNGVTRRKVIDRREGGVFLEGVTSPLSQPDWERRRWKLHRKAIDVPLTPQQVAEFAAVTEPLHDSVGTDGEGQS